MKKILILAMEQSVVQAIAGAQYCFQTVNFFLQQQGQSPLFEVHLVGLYEEVNPGFPGFRLQPDVLIENSFQGDLIIIPPLLGDFSEAISSNSKFLPWIRAQYESGAEVASLCVGAFFLAATGLIEGKHCSTHWGFVDQFKAMFPGVKVQDGSIVTEESGIYSSGGANSYWNLLLHLVEKYAGREMAILLSKYFAIDIDRESQASFSIFKGQKDHPDKQILQAQEIIEKNFAKGLTVDLLAEQVHLGRRSFERRFKKLTGNSVLEYVQRVKIEAAKRIFESSIKNCNEVMWEVGYTDAKAFRKVFQKITGLTPLEYRMKYNKVSKAA
ncbi:AraC family transcriptional regulator with amidase-like domain [Algoriphagus aquaeductus]|uniref:AraC family transcriptional regulator with amidase-like domain n=1 Tax=Algoriphagus aquaeductus TaxID=475299 RepID=A0A326RR77_9BACT|nr:helix-turn-helix domain-containing protein [Algoriphagus aquaeductus]PZV83999.1 AraC family transcriptional regulator with amidase-like domain [Algoriphagus aquaeductus]